MATTTTKQLSAAKPACRAAFRAAAGRPASRSLVCRAQQQQQPQQGRRAALAGLSAAAAGLSLLAPAPRRAWALIPDEEDEEMLERAKANRAKRLALQKETTRDFLREEGLKDKQLDAELIPVQKAVLELAKSGAQLEAGDIRGVASTLNGGWVRDFERATAVLDASEAENARAAAVVDGLGALKASAGSGDLKGSKQRFVAVVAALEDWATATGLAGDLKGL